jgi:hypothetical protein
MMGRHAGDEGATELAMGVSGQVPIPASKPDSSLGPLMGLSPQELMIDTEDQSVDNGVGWTSRQA